MLTRGLAVLTALVLIAGAAVPAQSNYMPVSDIRPGMVGIGRTVFEGDRLDEFKVQVLGVLHNQIGPRRDLILARLEGGPLARTGVIAGMSGSPVYIDGRLVGAVSYSLGEFATEPIAGITPDRRDDRGRDAARSTATHGARRLADSQQRPRRWLPRCVRRFRRFVPSPTVRLTCASPAATGVERRARHDAAARSPRR